MATDVVVRFQPNRGTAKMVAEPGAEPSIDDLLSDPLVRVFMAADSVDPEELRALLRSIAERLQAGARDR
jgi:hypothetical protein